jgi:ATP-dependent RNA helicase SUPV3L1/SUV3
VDRSKSPLVPHRISGNILGMAHASRAAVTAVLGPTNTGKTYLAVERLCAHSSGIMAFPLRLLAREVYDRVVAIKGPKEVGLITGEEKILPEGARWLLCTAESMPVDRDVAFVALDEAQLGNDPERGHVFTDRLLRARGREETMILGSEALRPMVRALVPDAEIITRPRFSKLSYDGPKKLSRLPPRSAIVAFSAEQVYAVAEMLRRARGGAAVVMGALSPRTRNAQVAMYQAGEVDYLVATDAIGMGLNMDVSHVAFAGLSKFDGRRQRRLMLSEMAQIAGRAGRHQRDGTFGTLSGGVNSPAFSEEDIERIENHSFPVLDHMFWRTSDLDFRSVDALIAALEETPDGRCLRAAPMSVDLAVLKALADDPAVTANARGAALVRRLWDAAGLPDFRKVGADHHARLVAQLYGHLSIGNGHIPADVFAREIAKLDNVQGDVETLASRIASVRTWAYIAHRPNWLADPVHWAGRTVELEEKLSDALHRKLTERFVDRRTTVLMRSFGADIGLLDVKVDNAGSVTVEDEEIGTLDGFRFSTAPETRLGERKKLLAAAEARLPRELARRAKALAECPDTHLALGTQTGVPVAVYWKATEVARLKPGSTLLAPRIAVDASITRLEPADRAAIEARLARFLINRVTQRLSPLARIARTAQDPSTPAALRALLAPLSENGGLISRTEVEDVLHGLDSSARRTVRQLGIVIGTLDVFHPALLKPESARLRIALHAVRAKIAMPPLPMAGLGLLDKPERALADAALIAGYRSFGDQMLRIDLVERIARAAHNARGTARLFTPDPKLAVSIGIGAATLSRILRAIGFQPVARPVAGPVADDIADPVQNQWRWQGRPRRASVARPVSGAFSALAAWRNP